MSALKYPDIPAFFAGKTVLVTGGTGFMGKVLLEKMLRSCPEVRRIYVIMRPKRGKEVGARLQDLVHSQVFDRVKEERPGVMSKLHAVAGDVSCEDLGLTGVTAFGTGSEADTEVVDVDEMRRRLLEEVSIVFHCAANVRFDLHLKMALNFNTKGTLQMLRLCRKMKHLEAFVHVSTAYCHCEQKVLEEITYEPPHDPHKLLPSMQWLPDDAVKLITPILIGNLPNTYAYSKNISEKLVTEYSAEMPIAIARPSIVTAAWEEPIPGWVETLHGPTGLLVGAGKGVIRSMHCKAEYLADIIPVDIAINALLAIAWKVGNTNLKGKPYVVNVTESGVNPVSWGDMLEYGRKHLYENPLENAIWFPDGSIKSNKTMHDLCVILFHYFPAYLLDFLITICGKKPFMVRIQNRIQGGLEILQYYTTKEWVFENTNFLSLWKDMTSQDKNIFPIDMTAVDWNPYIRGTVLGTRQFCLHEDLSTIPKARKHLRRLYYLDRAVSGFFYLLLIWITFCCTDGMISLFSWIMEGGMNLLHAATPGLRYVNAESEMDAILPPS
ncbi:putative fatty acyl-CoA reductase CG5065 [Ischnura elegans]|uniref:putative fatty acyl-CoA reductase CG5065 n=1 Tax=Ischnura elegans TaxID=197161 RepID=UPI001ED8A72A|nr:putative fatty acyl-CoA reductase CG5065 [Ischnura elegans]XP_046383095.1 putative fatty acyl-CoA reductase CG5065 [Ischnura elegans]